jgi:geranylgeranyl pyrophosphate synthase
MASKMMKAEATINSTLNINKLMTLFGRYYQIRDDYQDVLSADKEEETYSDLDQRAFTLPIIYALGKEREQGKSVLLAMLQSPKQNGGMSVGMKKMFVARLKEAGSLEYTKRILEELHGEIVVELSRIEEMAGTKNWILRLMFHRLKL